jgi:hypothetical protein
MNHYHCTGIPFPSERLVQAARRSEEAILLFASKLQPVKEYDLEMLHFAINHHIITGVTVYSSKNEAVIDLRNSHRLHIQIKNGKDFEEPKKLY